MEAGSNERRVVTRRKPFSDRTNTCSPSLVPLKPHKTITNPSSSAPAKCNTAATITTTTTTTTNLHNSPNPPSPSPSPLEIVDVEASEPITVVYSRRRSSNKRKRDKGKAVAVPFTTTPNFKISHTCEKDDEFEGANLPKAKAMTVPRTKKQCALSSEKDELKNHQLQEFIEKQKAYFKEIDEFKLEVESGDELD
ncbi:hypothetical protein AAZX31_02G243500 [Glycine max]|uniref:Sororin C-terminal region domain-containing protein n=2 Tax=Glycine subgen. Soja TaxID=1462606 RepID=I1JIB3_SOYBN|nr:uncharacterized protein LOC100792460 isoform X1 [Glycine max]XP_028217425.1 uncharacterized protein LOC114399434 isoform X1 [Glycine soja]KAH1062122.1 hypothetical protein GYH30_005237 [Glycine max]KAH1263353.1 hypothetical protein GmHk_02G005773 [Glycine max]KRH73221.1 hypothetical protein GLYMA_02G259600v4 [Glycine max]RZC26787.1 hypothetical protein D0Y65_005109 [Glycine soja]|eukprot:XP_014625440.1 uncharacterized protein LOC100792460 isoform X1 [Glycine max]